MAAPTASAKVPQGQAKKIQGTISPIEPFDVNADVAALQKALGTSTCETTLIDLLPKRDNAQRQQIREAYKTATGRELMDDINAKLSSGKFRDTVISLLDDPLQLQARALYQAMKGLGTDEKALVDVLCTKTRNVEITAIKETFTEMFSAQLETMLADEVSEPFLSLLITMAKAARQEGPSADIETQAKVDAEALFNGGEGRKSGPRDDNAFIDILGTRSLIQLNLATFKFYDQMSKKGGLEKAIEAEKCGHIEDGYIALIKTAKSELIDFFTDRLYKAMKGLGTDDCMVIRTIVSRSEIDLESIKDEFKTKYGVTLVDFVKDDTRGSYCDLLVAILQGGNIAMPAK